MALWIRRLLSKYHRPIPATVTHQELLFPLGVGFTELPGIPKQTASRHPISAVSLVQRHISIYGRVRRILFNKM